MKVKSKNVVAAVALVLAAAASGIASAAPLGTESLFFSARDNVNNTSLVINLGMTTADFRANPNAAFTLGGAELSGLQTYLSTANLGGVIWTVMGINDDGSLAGGTPSQNFGGLTTSTVALESVYNDWGQFGGLEATVNQTTTWRNLVNPNLAASNVYATSGAQAFKFALQDGGVGIPGTSVVGGTMAFYQFFAKAGNELFEGDNIKFAGSWSLNYSGGVASMTYSGAGTPEVPVPAAVWLLLSGVMGLVGVGRRKAAVAA
jgi:hypothetical protein